MPTGSLYARMQAHGTLTESPREIANAVYALPATVHWMRSLAILCEAQVVSFQTARTFYQRVQRKPIPDRQLNSIYEQLLLSLHHIAALDALTLAPNKADVSRVGIVSWYYGVYGAASAMIAAADGSFPETHASTARQWDRQFVVPGLVMPPFADRVGRLCSADVEEALRAPRGRGKHPLTLRPGSVHEAWGCVAEYLSGTVGWEQWNVEQIVRGSPAFRELRAENFRTKAARELRDEALGKRSVCFLNQASRYRGKANYRDAIFLAYGKSVPKSVEGFVDDLRAVLRAFSAMAAGYCAARVGREEWEWFVEDLARSRAISVSPEDIWT
jgi:hypothetical protein